MLFARSIATWLMIFGFCVAGVAARSATAAEESTAVAEEKAEAKPRAKARGRLPNFYSQVVTEKQRVEIYAIQGAYQDQLDELIRQVVAIKAERDAKVKATLTADQLKEVERLQAAAEKRREERRTAAAKLENAK
ncbi:hypothetical protein [Blastopirellula retiformator]|nr:hypothetical protein [Blastopirellula retiformator]